MSATRRELEHWASVAPCWVAGAPRIARMTHAVSEALVQALAPARGERVVDFACGAGDPALQLAQRVGGEGRVVACDAVPAMLAALHADRDASSLTLVQCTAEHPAFADASFDALSCRFGLMFFAAPLDTLRAWRALLRPGGRAVCAVWGADVANPYFSVARDALDAVGAPPPPKLPNEGRGVFEYAEPGHLAALLRDAGFARVTEHALDFAMELPGVPPDALLHVQRELSPIVAERCATLEAPALERAARRVAQRAAAWRDAAGTGLAIPGRALILRAERA